MFGAAVGAVTLKPHPASPLPHLQSPSSSSSALHFLVVPLEIPHSSSEAAAPELVIYVR